MDLPPTSREELSSRNASSNKATKHRKRHIPVGPAGIWFQSTLHPIASRPGVDDRGQKRPLNSGDGKEEEEEDTAMKPADFMVEDPRLSRHHPSSDYFLSPAWTSAHCTLHLVTPSLSSLRNVTQRVSILRRHLPRQYVLFSDLSSSEPLVGSSWKMSSTDRLLCQVLSVRSDQSGTIARLRDETGSLFSAWISPALVRAEATAPLRARSDHSDFGDGAKTIYLRQGMVWLLHNCTLQLVDVSPSHCDPLDHEYDSDDDSDWIDNSERGGTRRLRSSWERMLLVGESNLIQAWSNSNADQMDTADYIAWLEARNSLTMTVLNELSLASPSMNINRRQRRTPRHDTGMHSALDFNEQEHCSTNEMVPTIVPLCALQRVFPTNSQTQNDHLVHIESNQSDRRTLSSPRCQNNFPPSFDPLSGQQPRIPSPLPNASLNTERSSFAAMQQVTTVTSSAPTRGDLMRSTESSGPCVQQMSLSQFAAPSASNYLFSEEYVEKSSSGATIQEDTCSSEPLKEVQFSQFAAPSTSTRSSLRSAVHIPSPKHVERRTTQVSVDTLVRTNTVSQPPSTSNVYSAATSNRSIFNLLDIEEEDMFAAAAPVIGTVSGENAPPTADKTTIDPVSYQSSGSSLYHSSFVAPSGMTIESMFDDLDG
jgi:hypothetical protein